MSPNKAFFLVGLAIIGLTLHSAQAEHHSYVGCFEKIRDQFKWPLDMMEEQCRAGNIFGPIISQCLNPGEYGFTRSVAFGGKTESEKVYAVLGGKVVKTGTFFKGNDHLHTVIIEHELPGDNCRFGEQSVTSFFTIYGHLVTGTEDKPYKVEVGQMVSAGDVIGYTGVSTRCEGTTKASLLYQVRLDLDFCPDLQGDCGTYGSPVHPFLTQPSMERTTNYELEREFDGSDDLTVSVTTPCSETAINQYKIKCGTKTEGKSIINVEKTHLFDLNFREGFGPIPQLYAQDVTKPYIEPEMFPFSPRSLGKWKTSVVVPSSWFAMSDTTKCCNVQVTDLFDEEVSMGFCGSELDVTKSFSYLLG